MSNFVCSKCQCIESVSMADYYTQIYINKTPPLCCYCRDGKHHEKFKRQIATVTGILQGEINNFDHFKEVDIVKKLMIDEITMNDKSCIPRNVFEKMNLKEVKTIYFKIKGA